MLNEIMNVVDHFNYIASVYGYQFWLIIHMRIKYMVEKNNYIPLYTYCN